jgi:hypothetical protein
MPRTNIVVLQATRAGVTVSGTAADVANGNTIASDGHIALLLRNTNSGSTARTLTIHVAATVDGLAVTDRTVTVPAGAEKLVGPFSPREYGGRLKINGDNAELLITPIRVA